MDETASRKVVIEFDEDLVGEAIQNYGFEPTEDRIKQVLEALNNGDGLDAVTIVNSCIEFLQYGW